MSSWSEQPIVHVANGIVWADEERGFSWELTEMDGYTECLADKALGVSKEREWQVAE